MPSTRWSSKSFVPDSFFEMLLIFFKQRFKIIRVQGFLNKISFCVQFHLFFFPNNQGFRRRCFSIAVGFYQSLVIISIPAFIHSHFKNSFNLIYAKMWEEENCLVGVFDTFWIVLFKVFSKVIENIRHSYGHSAEDLFATWLLFSMSTIRLL